MLGWKCWQDRCPPKWLVIRISRCFCSPRVALQRELYLLKNDPDQRGTVSYHTSRHVLKSRVPSCFFFSSLFFHKEVINNHSIQFFLLFLLVFLPSIKIHDSLDEIVWEKVGHIAVKLSFWADGKKWTMWKLSLIIKSWRSSPRAFWKGKILFRSAFLRPALSRKILLFF